MFLDPARVDRCIRSARQRRPQAEGLEPRALLAAGASPLLIGVLGDSLSDEYAFYGPPTIDQPALESDVATVGLSSARNWVMNLAATRSASLSFGAYRTTPRSGTRAQGFAEDWARIGAIADGDSTNTLAAQVMGHPGLLTQTPADSGVRPQALGAVVLMIGTNDYLASLGTFLASGGASDDYVPRPGESVDPLNQRLEKTIRATVASIHQTSPKALVVVATPLDLTQTPIGAALRSTTPPYAELGQQFQGSLQALNADLARTAQTQRYGLVDTQAILAARLAVPTVAGVTINDEASGPAWTNGFVGDGTHPGSVIQGFFAQGIVRQLNAQAGRTVVPPLSDAEIIRYAQAVQSTVTLASIPAATPGLTTLTARVTAGPGSTTIPTGVVEFEAITPAVGDLPKQFGTVLGTVALDGSGTATLTVPTATLATASFHAVYQGDQGHTAAISPGDGF